jgi:hypothetical protein
MARGERWVAGMPTPRNPREGREDEKRERKEGERPERPRARRRERPRGHGREREAFLEYLARRWAGSPPPTAEAYARAERQWRRLPGAIVTQATDLGNAPERGTTSGDGRSEA